MKQSHESNKPEDAVWARGSDRTTSETAQVANGNQFGCCLHMLLLPIWFLLGWWLERFGADYPYIFSAGIAFSGVLQLLYMVPALFWARKQGKAKGFQKGLVLAAVQLFLFNATCFGILSMG